jgi:hypothetical protein
VRRQYSPGSGTRPLLWPLPPARRGALGQRSNPPRSGHSGSIPIGGVESVHGGRYSDEHMFGAGGLTGHNQQGADGWT